MAQLNAWIVPTPGLRQQLAKLRFADIALDNKMQPTRSVEGTLLNPRKRAFTNELQKKIGPVADNCNLTDMTIWNTMIKSDSPGAVKKALDGIAVGIPASVLMQLCENLQVYFPGKGEGFASSVLARIHKACKASPNKAALALGLSEVFGDRRIVEALYSLDGYQYSDGESCLSRNEAISGVIDAYIAGGKETAAELAEKMIDAKENHIDILGIRGKKALDILKETKRDFLSRF